MAKKRYEDWPVRLADFLELARLREFNRGQWDCALFACEAGQVMTGYDYASAFRGQYKNLLSAKKRLKEFSGGGLYETVCLILGDPLVTSKKAQRGDCVLFSNAEDGDALGIVDLTGVNFCSVAKEAGLIKLPLSKAKFAWRV